MDAPPIAIRERGAVPRAGSWRADPRLRWLAVVLAGLLAVVAFDVWWIAGYRHGYPLTIDETGYIAFGLADHFGLQSEGLHGWWEAVNHQAPYAPLVPAVTSIVMGIKAGVLEAFGVLIGFMALLALAIYGIGQRLAGPRLGALAALLAATAPGTFLFVREYVFALPVAALLACAVYALLASEGLRSWRWSVACGAAVGLKVLARTMTVAFIPAILLAAAIAIAARTALESPAERRLAKRCVNLGLLALIALAIAATWYVRNFNPVFDYLTAYGYGEQSSYYGQQHSLLSWARWHTVADRMTDSDLLLPLAVLVLGGLIVVAVRTGLRLSRAANRREALLRLGAGDALAVAVVFAGCYLALTSSRNGGEGFTYPISMLLLPLAVMALRGVRASVAGPAVAAVLSATALNVASNSSLWESLARTRTASVPGFGTLRWINGTPAAVSAIREQIPGPATRFVERDKGWPRTDERLAAIVTRMMEAGARPPIAFASRNRATNTSSLLLAGMVAYHQSLPLSQLTAEPEDSVANYVRELSSADFGVPGILVTMSDETGDFPPVITQAYAETAARRLDFRRVRTLPLPDGRQLRVWRQFEAPLPREGRRVVRP
jgi:hypothetical protein